MTQTRPMIAEAMGTALLLATIVGFGQLRAFSLQ
jgi:hypothetical protein